MNEMLAVEDRIDQVQLTILERAEQLKSMMDDQLRSSVSVFTWRSGTPGRGPRRRHLRRHFQNSIDLLGHARASPRS